METAEEKDDEIGRETAEEEAGRVVILPVMREKEGEAPVRQRP